MIRYITQFSSQYTPALGFSILTQVEHPTDLRRRDITTASTAMNRYVSFLDCRRNFSEKQLPLEFKLEFIYD